jgi:perosamine synthetase
MAPNITAKVAFSCNDKALFDTVLTLSNHGRVGQTKRLADMVGFKYKMSNVQAAIGCAQVERIDELIQRKRSILGYYREKLDALSGLAMNPEPEGSQIGAWMPTVVFGRETGITREVLQAAFASENIDARVFFWPLSALAAFKPVPTNGFAWEIPGRAINLPSFHDIGEDDLKRVIAVVKSALNVCVCNMGLCRPCQVLASLVAMRGGM